MDMLVMPFGVDIDVIRSAFGSKDENLFQKVQQTPMYKMFDEELSFKRELYDIIFKYVPEDKRTVTPSKLFGLIGGNDGRGLDGEWEDYGYALLCICDYFGDSFIPENPKNNYDKNWHALNLILKEQGCSYLLDRLIEPAPIFDVPYKEKAIYCNYFNKKEVAEFSLQFSKIENTMKSKENDLRILYDQLKGGFDFCVSRNYDLVSFSYESED